MKRGLFVETKPTMLIVITVLIAAILTDSLAQAQINVEPNTALLNEGDRTELLCRYGRPINYCRIEIPGEKVLNLSPDWSKTPGFTYYGAGLATGQCGVSIERVKATNNGPVKCSLGVEGEELTGSIELVVALRPQQPYIELFSKPERDGYFSKGSNFQARCVVSNGRPAANITWYLDDQPANKRTGTLDYAESDLNENLKVSTVSQEIQWHLGAEDNGRQLICRSHHQTDRENVPPQEGSYQLLVRFPPVRQNENDVYGLYLDHTAVVNVTIRANPAPVVEWTVDGMVIPQGTQNGRFAVYEPQYLGQDYYNVTMTIAGLTLEDTTKIYQMRASNSLGTTDYQVRISSSKAPPATGLDIAAIVGIVVALAIVIIIVLLVLFARATGRWCFGGKSIKSPTNETSDTESADVKATSTATTATTAAASDGVSATANPPTATTTPGAVATETGKSKSKRLPTFAAIFKRFNEKDASKKHKLSDNNDDEETLAADANATDNEHHEPTDGNDNQPKEDKQLVYAELVLKPADKHENPQQQQQLQAAAAQGTQQQQQPKTSTEYAEIVYVQKQEQQQPTQDKK